ncbi:MAG: ABC transporter ATP-binding protein [Candidatus Latescibacterota bacterium]
MNSVELLGITKTFGSTTAVDALSLSVPRGSIYGFIGPNGSGKTTTLRMIMNIFYPDSGKILLFGEKSAGACTDRIGYLPEERGLYKSMKVREILRFYGKLKSGKDVSGEVDRWLARLDLAGWAEKPVSALSKGMSQKVQFLATVITGPELIILDEPFSGLDPVNTEAIKDAVLEFRERGATVIFSTHDMSMAERMCDYIFMIFKGKKVLDGTLASIQDRYGTDTIRVKGANGLPPMQELRGIEAIKDFGNMQELRMSPGCDPRYVLQAILAKTAISSFEIVRPSLHDIFLRIAGPETREATHA